MGTVRPEDEPEESDVYTQLTWTPVLVLAVWTLITPMLIVLIIIKV